MPDGRVLLSQRPKKMGITRKNEGECFREDKGKKRGKKGQWRVKGMEEKGKVGKVREVGKEKI